MENRFESDSYNAWLNKHTYWILREANPNKIPFLPVGAVSFRSTLRLVINFFFFLICFRYDHFATLCETLPASIPSLAVNLLVASRGYFDNSMRKILAKALACGVTSNVNQFARDSDTQSSFLNLDNDMFLWNQFSRCSFNGSQFYRILSRWHSLQRDINDYLLSTRVKKGEHLVLFSIFHRAWTGVFYFYLGNCQINWNFGKPSFPLK